VIHVSGRPAGTRHGSQWLRRALIESARATARTKNSYYSAQYARIARRRGANKAAAAVANSMLFTIWHLLSTVPCMTTRCRLLRAPSRSSRRGEATRTADRGTRFRRQPHREGRSTSTSDNLNLSSGQHPPRARPSWCDGKAFPPRVMGTASAKGDLRPGGHRPVTCHHSCAPCGGEIIRTLQLTRSIPGQISRCGQAGSHRASPRDLRASRSEWRGKDDHRRHVDDQGRPDVRPSPRRRSRRHRPPGAREAVDRRRITTEHLGPLAYRVGEPLLPRPAVRCPSARRGG